VTISHHEWRIAYAKQALADLHARERLLEDPKLPECQQLHYLQMACEKLCKAHLCGQGTDLKALQKSHAYIAGPLPIIVRQQFAQQRHKDSSWMLGAIRSLARKIELLAPAIEDAGRQPSNVEYPWAGPDGAIHTPCEHNFKLNLLHDEAGRHLLKVLYTAAEALTRSHQT